MASWVFEAVCNCGEWRYHSQADKEICPRRSRSLPATIKSDLERKHHVLCVCERERTRWRPLKHLAVADYGLCATYSISDELSSHLCLRKAAWQGHCQFGPNDVWRDSRRFVFHPGVSHFRFSYVQLSSFGMKRLPWVYFNATDETQIHQGLKIGDIQMTVACCTWLDVCVHARACVHACAHASKIFGYFLGLLFSRALFPFSTVFVFFVFFITICISFDTRRLKQTCVVIKLGEACL